MKWEPADVIRVIALIGAFALVGLGAFMMTKGIAAEGAVDIKSSVLSGSVKTGSAGLFIVFFGFSIVAFVLGSLTTGKRTQTPSQDKSRLHHLVLAFWATLVAVILTGGLAASGYGSGFGTLAVFLSVLLLGRWFLCSLS